MTQKYKRKQIIVTAEQKLHCGTIATKRGTLTYNAGDWIVEYITDTRIYTNKEFKAEFEKVPIKG